MKSLARGDWAGEIVWQWELNPPLSDFKLFFLALGRVHHCSPGGFGVAVIRLLRTAACDFLPT